MIAMLRELTATVSEMQKQQRQVCWTLSSNLHALIQQLQESTGEVRLYYTGRREVIALTWIQSSELPRSVIQCM